MKHLRIVLLCVCVFVPNLASADDGGWWDALWKWDAKLTGGNTEIHLLCLDGVGRRVIGCEEWFKGMGPLFKGNGPVHHSAVIDNPVTHSTVKINSFDEIKHEINLRVGYYHNYGDRYAAPEPSIGGSINAVPTIGTYYYHINKYFSVGAGMGVLTIYGDKFDPFMRSILIPASYIIRPLPGHGRLGAIILRAEVNYMPEGFTAADFGDGGVSHYSNRSEWHTTIGFGFDLRRIGTFQ